MLFPVFSVLNLWNITPTLHVYFTGAVSPFRCRWSSHVCTFRFHRFYTVRKIVYRSNNILQWLVQNWIHQRAMNSVTNNSNCIGFRRYTWFDSITIADTESNFYFKICGLNTNSTSEVQLIFSHKNMKQTFESVYENEDQVNSGSKYMFDISNPISVILIWSNCASVKWNDRSVRSALFLMRMFSIILLCLLQYSENVLETLPRSERNCIEYKVQLVANILIFQTNKITRDTPKVLFHHRLYVCWSDEFMRLSSQNKILLTIHRFLEFSSR